MSLVSYYSYRTSDSKQSSDNINCLKNFRGLSYQLLFALVWLDFNIKHVVKMKVNEL